MKKLLLIFALLPALANAQPYVCDCGTGSHPTLCAANQGVDTNDGSTPALAKRTIAAVSWGTLAAGTVVRVCDGGSMTVAGTQIHNTNSTRSSPITIQPYAPSNGATGTPIFRASATNEGLVFGNFAINEPTGLGHYVVRGINFDGVNDGTTTGNHGLYLFGVASFIGENLTLQRWGFGVEIACTTVTCETSPGPASNNVTIRDSLISRNTNMGILGGAVNFVVTGTHFDRNATANNGQIHNFYLTHSRGFYVANNLFENPGNATTGGTTCSAGNLTMHGIISGGVVENNEFVNTTTAANCGGLSIKPGYDTAPIIAETMRDIRVTSNRFRNGPIHLACVPRLKVESNSFVFTEQPLASPFILPATECTTKTAPVDAADTGAVIRNNSMLFDHSVSSGITGFQLSGFDGIGTGVIFTGNLVRFQNTAGAGSRTCFQNSALANYTYHGNNGCFNFSAWSAAHSTLALSQAAGYDTGSLDSDPGFAATPGSGNNWSMKLGGASPYLAAGSATNGPRRSIDGWNRPTTPSIGAFDASNP